MNILLICFNRPIETRKVLDRIFYFSSVKNLYIQIDFENSKEHKEVVKIVNGFKGLDNRINIQIQVNKKNLGCKDNFIKGLNWIFKDFEQAIILEDDTLPMSVFFDFAESMLDTYKNDKRVFQVSGTNIHKIPFDKDYGFSKFATCWGWGTWRDRWELFKEHQKDLTSKVLPFYLSYDLKRHLNIKTTWDYNWFYTILLNHGLCVTPKYNLVKNISNSGTHLKKKWDLKIGTISDFRKLKYMIPNKRENLYYFISQIKSKLTSI